MSDLVQTTIDEAIDRVERHADVAWKRAAADAVRRMKPPQRFTTDDLWDALDALDVSTHEPRAMGAVMRAAKREGLVVSTRTYLPSRRVECHGRPVLVWERIA